MNSEAAVERKETVPRFWLVAQNIIGQCQHEDMIGNIVKKNRFGRKVREKGIVQPLTKSFGEIAYGDIIVYYAYDYKLVTGIFKKIRSGKEEKNSTYQLLSDDFCWSESIVHKIEPVALANGGKYVDMKKLIDDNKKKDSTHRISEETSAYLETLDTSPELQKNICKVLSENDYIIIENALSDSEYLVDADNRDQMFKNRFSGWRINPEVLSALLDFHNNRSTSFVSLFVASIFGIVTLSAIAQSIFGSNIAYFASVMNFLPVVLSAILYVAFAFAGAYTLDKFFFYADMASNIKYCLEGPYYEELNKPLVHIVKGDKSARIGLADFLKKRESQEQHSWKRNFLNLKYSFIILYVLVILILFSVVYWNPVTKPLLDCLGSLFSNLFHW